VEEEAGITHTFRAVFPQEGGRDFSVKTAIPKETKEKEKKEDESCRQSKRRNENVCCLPSRFAKETPLAHRGEPQGGEKGKEGDLCRTCVVKGKGQGKFPDCCVGFFCGKTLILT